MSMSDETPGKIRERLALEQRMMARLVERQEAQAQRQEERRRLRDACKVEPYRPAMAAVHEAQVAELTSRKGKVRGLFDFFRW
ncbi:hypothetical protein [Rhizobium sp. BG4]|uniref:hypothetical protein n=1 Tax=Rhizobium sp. BG4 TaxID=2613770 RepID=UPI00193D537A|nr:hypothetical protein [Rhizobium sp. BG4]QRM45348.1 hypothetical protein F2982_19020 [Rhizobium sp. BG4]